MFTQITIAQARRQIKLGDRVGMRVTILLTAFALLGALAPPAFGQARASTLTPSRDSAPPGATLNIAVDPALGANQPDGSHLVLRSAQGRRGSADVELQIADWRANAIRAAIPRDARIGVGATRLLLLNRRNEVIAHSGNQMFRVVAVGELPSAGRVAGAEGSRTGVPGSGPISRGPGSQAPDVAGRRGAPERSAGPVVPNVPNLLPSPDPRTERGVHARPGVPSTPGILGRARGPEVASDGAGGRRRPPFLRDQRLPGMDYRRLAVRSVAECHTACSIESQCRSWEFRPAQRNDTFDNGDDGPTCFLKSGIPQREYARGHVSGIKPPPPAVAAAAPHPPDVSR